MGYSSTAIFGNDLASDVRATYRELLEDGVSAEELGQLVRSGNSPV